jgi:hypothetical protein
MGEEEWSSGLVRVEKKRKEKRMMRGPQVLKLRAGGGLNLPARKKKLCKQKKNVVKSARF